MADFNARVMDMVRRELEKDRSVATEDLFAKARKIDSSLSRLDIRQFHAKYPLQVKRAMGRGRRGGRPAGTRKRGRPPASASASAPARKRGRKRGPGRPPGRPRKSVPAEIATGGGAGRDSVRTLLLQFAREVAGADGKADMVDVMAGVEGWVDRLISAAGR
jgi:hypothetical protein